MEWVVTRREFTLTPAYKACLLVRHSGGQRHLIMAIARGMHGSPQRLLAARLSTLWQTSKAGKAYAEKRHKGLPRAPKLNKVVQLRALHWDYRCVHLLCLAFVWILRFETVESRAASNRVCAASNR